MGLIVQKFGGTSVGSMERIQHVARKIEGALSEGNRVVVVVSAMGTATDGLVDMARQLSNNPMPKAMDLLLSSGEIVTSSLLTIALQEIGIEAVPLTGWQAGILTDDSHGNAAILTLQKENILQHINQGKVVVVAGFQGVTEQGEVTTLGRGGSDITAVALAAYLKAERCDIFTDVRGVYTADPRKVETAQLIKHIRYEEMLTYAQLGAQVLHPRAVEWARRHQVSLVVKSSFEDGEGTWISDNVPYHDSLGVYGVTYQSIEDKITQISVIGTCASVNKIEAIIRQSLADINIEILRMLSTENSVSCMVPNEDTLKALQHLHEVFGLEKAQINHVLLERKDTPYKKGLSATMRAGIMSIN